MTEPKRPENRITLPQHLRERAHTRVQELGYGSLLEYVSELVILDTSPLVDRVTATVPPLATAPKEQAAPVVNNGGWGGEI